MCTTTSPSLCPCSLGALQEAVHVAGSAARHGSPRQTCAGHAAAVVRRLAGSDLGVTYQDAMLQEVAFTLMHASAWTQAGTPHIPLQYGSPGTHRAVSRAAACWRAQTHARIGNPGMFHASSTFRTHTVILPACNHIIRIPHDGPPHS